MGRDAYGESNIVNAMKRNARCNSIVIPTVPNAIGAGRSNKKERRVDALALRADERRDKLRKASGRSKYPLIRRSLNGETCIPKRYVSIRQSITYGGEPGELKHLSTRRKRKKHRFPK